MQKLGVNNNNMPIPLNKSLNKILSQNNNYQNNNYKNCSNMKLLFNKLVYNWSKNDFEYTSKNISEFFTELESKSKDDQFKNFYKVFIENWRNTLANIPDIKIFSGSTQSRLAIGLGNETILENSLTLHSIWGIPYIPGSALKGVTRNYYINKILLKDLKESADIIDNLIFAYSEVLKNKSDETKLKKLTKIKQNKKEIFANESTIQKIKTGWFDLEKAYKIFGASDNEGAIIFYDAYPEEYPKLKSDIMNPHFGDYYSDKNAIIAPGDWLSNNPIKFITVDKNEKFIFVLGKRKNSKISDVDFTEIYNIVKEALEFSGIGAKTSVNYGYFHKFDEKIDTQIALDLKKELEQKERQVKEKKMFDAMTEIEKVVYQIKNSTDKDENKVIEFYTKIDNYNESDKKIIAASIKEYWEKINKWNSKTVSEKQNKKIEKIKKILEG